MLPPPLAALGRVRGPAVGRVGEGREKGVAELALEGLHREVEVRDGAGDVALLIGRLRLVDLVGDVVGEADRWGR